jgi:uncharacterized protein (TIGR03083 family)
MTTQTAAEVFPLLSHDQAMELAATEYDRLLALADALTNEDWSKLTECAPWTVQDMLGHLIGMFELLSDPTEMRRQITAAGEVAATVGGLRIDALTDLQVREHAHLSPNQVREALRQTAPLALAARRATTPERRSLPYDPAMPGEGVWSLGYLFDTIHTRDPWMHRIDICRAIGREPHLTAAHDGRIIADVVADWSQRHGQPVTLDLSGPAGDHYLFGAGGPQLHLDAIDFCRIVSGRGSGDGLLSVHVPF